MRDIINRIYELTNSVILTPHNLLDNIMLENYKEIKYSKNGDVIICEITVVEEGEKESFLYEFDFDNKLQRAYALNCGDRFDIFDREKELKDILLQYDSLGRRRVG